MTSTRYKSRRDTIRGGRDYRTRFAVHFARIHRKAKEHKANLTSAQLDMAADSLALQDTINPEVTPYQIINSDNLFDRVTVREFTARESFARYFGDCEEIDLSTLVRYQDRNGFTQTYWMDEAIVTIPLTCKGHELDAVTIANNEYLHAEYPDLFAYGLLVDHDGCVAILLDKPYYDAYKLETLLDSIHDLQTDYMFCDQTWSDVRMRLQDEMVASELDSFIRNLDLHHDVQTIFFPEVPDNWRKPIDWENAPFAKADWIAHMWDLICKNDVELENNDPSLDTVALAEKSPFYKMGYKLERPISELDAKLESTAILCPQYSDLINQVRGDLADVLKNQTPAHMFFSL